MTTKVTIDPANHEIEVAVVEGDVTNREYLLPGTPPRDFWIYQGRSLSVREVPG